MAFSIRKIISNISYFSKPGEGESSENDSPRKAGDETNRQNYSNIVSTSDNLEFNCVEADSTSKSAQSLNLPASVKSYTLKKGSHSDTDILAINIPTTPEKRKCRKLKLDVKKASQSDLTISDDSSFNAENTPKDKLLECKNSDLFKGFNFNQSFDISDAISDTSYDDNIDIESLSDNSDTESGDNADGASIKMCRKVEEEPAPSATPESFADVEIDKNEDERISLLLNYQNKIEKLDSSLKKLLNDFQFHIEVSKVFNCKTVVTALPGTDMTSIPKGLGDIKYIDNIQRGVSPGWNIVMEKEDAEAKSKLKNQLTAIRNNIDNFIHNYLEEKPRLSRERRSITFDLHKGKRIHKQTKISHKKKIKHYDFPDYRDAMMTLFCDNHLSDDEKCQCCCHSSDLDTTVKSDKETNQSITSSLGNFSLDSSTLSAFSESLDQIVSYNSFQDTSIYSTILQKSAIERITFYIQVHSIQLKCEVDESNKNIITFFCPSCNEKEFEENGLLKHILSQYHCEKIHFLYKTAYVKKCISNGKEIMPSTVLNPMTYYRDENKIVCFGDAVYACSLCFENLILGESVLMVHCTEEEHVNRRDMLVELV